MQYQNNNDNAKFYVVKRFRLLEWLLDCGHVYLKQQPDRNNPHYSVWIFKKTPKLMADIDSYYSQPFFTELDN